MNPDAPLRRAGFGAMGAKITASALAPAARGTDLDVGDLVGEHGVDMGDLPRAVTESWVGYSSSTSRVIRGQYNTETLSHRSSRTWKNG